MDSEFLAYTSRMMRTCGLWPHTCKEFLRGVLTILLYLLVVLMYLPLLDPADMVDFTATLCLIMSCGVTLAKTFFIKVYQSRGERMVSDTKERCSRLAVEFPEHKELLERTDLRLRRIIKGLITFSIVTFGSWMVLPVLNAIGVFSEFDPELPIKMWYPMDLRQRGNFAIAVCHQLSCLLVCASPYVMANMIYIVLISLTCVQLQVLSLALGSIDETNIRRRLSFCIDIHSSIIASGKELESLMSPILLLKFVVYVAMMCECLIQHTLGPVGSEQTVKSTAYLSLLLVEIWLYCYFGNQLTDHSLRIQTAVYNSAWYNTSPSNQRSIQLVILRSQRPLRLTLGKMYVVSLETFAEVLKLCYSLFNLLREVGNKASDLNQRTL